MAAIVEFLTGTVEYALGAKVGSLSFGSLWVALPPPARR